MRVRIALTGILAVFLLLVGATGAGAIERERIALRAARKAIGTPYVYGGANLGGFDCSGLTMWAWGRADKNLPHSAYMQFQRIDRHVSRSKLQRGDLLFFYRPVSHVGMYIGHGKMIAASHSGTRVGRQRVYWGSFVGGRRPVR